MTWVPVSVGGTVVAVDSATGQAMDPAGSRPATAEELAAAVPAAAEYEARAVSAAANGSARTALADALALAALYPAPTPEETALIDAQVASALANYRALDNPPADVVSLAAAVVAWRTEVAL